MESRLTFKVLPAANPQVGYREVTLPNDWFMAAICWYCTDSSATNGCNFGTYCRANLPDNSDWEYRIGIYGNAGNTPQAYGNYLAFKLSKYKYYLSSWKMNSIQFATSIHTYILYTG